MQLGSWRRGSKWERKGKRVARVGERVGEGFRVSSSERSGGAFRVHEERACRPRRRQCISLHTTPHTIAAPRHAPRATRRASRLAAVGSAARCSWKEQGCGGWSGGWGREGRPLPAPHRRSFVDSEEVCAPAVEEVADEAAEEAAWEAAWAAVCEARWERLRLGLDLTPAPPKRRMREASERGSSGRAWRSWAGARLGVGESREVGGRGGREDRGAPDEIGWNFAQGASHAQMGRRWLGWHRPSATQCHPNATAMPPLCHPNATPMPPQCGSERSRQKRLALRIAAARAPLPGESRDAPRGGSAECAAWRDARGRTSDGGLGHGPRGGDGRLDLGGMRYRGGKGEGEIPRGYLLRQLHPAPPTTRKVATRSIRLASAR